MPVHGQDLPLSGTDLVRDAHLALLLVAQSRAVDPPKDALIPVGHFLWDWIRNQGWELGL
jgi:hypothetical protein